MKYTYKSVEFTIISIWVIEIMSFWSIWWESFVRVSQSALAFVSDRPGVSDIYNSSHISRVIYSDICVKSCIPPPSDIRW